MPGTVRWRAWARLRSRDLAGLDPERAVAVLPVAAVEQHGPHLPLGTDALILEAVLEQARAELELGGAAHDLDVLVLPAQVVGDSLEHTDFPGTLTQRPEALIEAWTALGEAVHAAGLRKLAVVNSHGGQPQVVDVVAQRLRATRRMLVARVHTFRLGTPEGLFDADELAFGYHGGEVETSLMLAIAPGLVDLDSAARFDSLAAELARELRVLRAEPGAGHAGFAWQAQDLHPSGATGNAAAADEGRGRMLLAHLARRVADALRDVVDLPLATLREGPAGDGGEEH